MRPLDLFIAVTAVVALTFVAHSVLRAEDYRRTREVFVDAKARNGQPLCMTITAPEDIAGDVCVNYVKRSADVEVDRAEIIF